MKITTNFFKIPYRDLSVTDGKLKSELLRAVEGVLSHGRLINGPEVFQFEEKIADYCGRKYAVGVNSGTDALYLALRSLDVGPGDEVITTPLSWIATLNAITLCGAKPIFVDIGDDLNIAADLVEQAITPATKVLLPVHFTGKLCEIEKIAEIAYRRNVWLIEDAAQAFGAISNGDQKAGSFGHLACFSMNPMKVFCSYGEAGAILTDDKTIYSRLQALRYNGTINKENCHYPSLNGRMDTIQAAMLLVEFNYLENKINRRREIAAFYTRELGDIVGCPQEQGFSHIYYSYTITTEKRDQLQQYLKSRGIETKIMHPILMPYHTAYRGLPRYSIPNAERLVKQILCLPNSEKLTNEQAEYVVHCIREFFK